MRAGRNGDRAREWGCRRAVLGRSGGDRLSRALGHSTMGAGAFNGRVRDGIGFWARRSSHRTGEEQLSFGKPAFCATKSRQRSVTQRRARAPAGPGSRVRSSSWTVPCARRTRIMRAIKLNRAISTGQLSASPRLHTRPINVVVFHGSQGSSRFKVGFPLRCLQRLSRPTVAMLHCGWRHNSSTRGSFIPVLSY